METLGQRIRRLIEERGVTHKWVYTRANIGKSYFSLIINDRRYPGVPMLKRIAKVLDTTIDELVPDTDEPEQEAIDNEGDIPGLFYPGEWESLSEEDKAYMKYQVDLIRKSKDKQ